MKTAMTRNKWLVLAILAALQMADALSTRMALHAGAVELSPLVRMLGLWQSKAFGFIAVVLLVRWSASLRRVWTVAAVYLLIVGSNLWTVFKLR